MPRLFLKYKARQFAKKDWVQKAMNTKFWGSFKKYLRHHIVAS
jgi:hypothetical protein